MATSATSLADTVLFAFRVTSVYGHLRSAKFGIFLCLQAVKCVTFEYNRVRTSGKNRTATVDSKQRNRCIRTYAAQQLSAVGYDFEKIAASQSS